MGKCSFKSSWLAEKDGNGYYVREWLTSDREDAHMAFCKVCGSSLSVVIGFQAIRQHWSSAKHKKLSLIKLSPGQLKLEVARPDSLPSTSSRRSDDGIGASVQLAFKADAGYTAAVYWVLKCCVSNFPANSCDGIEQVFKLMFPEGVPADFSLGRTKFTYLLNFGVAPYFRAELSQDLAKSSYTLLYDETTDDGGNKELQIGVRYWSEAADKIASRYLQTFFIGSATADVLLNDLKLCMAEYSLPTGKLLMLGSDGPKVNQKVFRLMNEALKEDGEKGLIDLGTCNVHIVHNGFQKGIDALGEDAANLVTAVHEFFAKWPSRWEDFQLIQKKHTLPAHVFLKHVQLRWLTLGPAVDRLLEQWEAVVEYFLVFVPEKKKNFLKKKGYRAICGSLKSPTMKAELSFISSSARLLTTFTGTFQREEPLIHLLYSELADLTTKQMMRCCKDSAIEQYGLSLRTLETANLLSPEHVVCGDDVIKELSKIHERDRLEFLKEAQGHYVAIASHILEKSALRKKSLVKCCRSIHPKERTKKRSCDDIVTIARSLPISCDIKTDILLDEWKLLQLEKDNPGSEDGRIDSYWAQFFALKKPTGEKKYPTVAVVVKAILSLSHGQADIERGFSSSGRTLTSDRASMSECTLNSYMMVKDTMARRYGNKPENVIMTRELLACARGAHAKYQDHMEGEKKKKEDAARLSQAETAKKAKEEERMRQLREGKERLNDDKEKLKTMRAAEAVKREAAEELVEVATKRLKTALAKKDMGEVALAQAMLEGVQAVRKEAREARREAEKTEEKIEKRTSKLLSDVLSKQSKNT